MSTTMKAQASSTVVRAALRYAQAGYPVLLVWPLKGTGCGCPKGEHCATPGKHPIHSKWERSATTDTDKVKAMFNKFPHAHVGIMPPEGYSIIDVDPRNGGNESMKALMGSAKLPKTTVQHSGGGGLHLVFKGEPNKPLGKGIDIKRYRRGFVVAWPSAHISGGSYTWKNAPWETDPAPLPAYMRGKEREEHTPADPDELADPTIYADGAAPTLVPLNTVREALAHLSADDYHRWVNVGQALRHTYGDEGEELWIEWSKSSSKYEQGDEEKWQSFDHNRDRTLITIRSIMSMARRSGYRPLTREFDDSLWVLGDITRYIETAPPVLPVVIEPCLVGGKVALLAGAGGSSKSFLALTLAMYMACGEALGPFKPVSAGKALLLVAEEDASDVHRRVSSVMAGREFTDEQLHDIKERVGVVPVRGLDWRLVCHDEAGDIQETDRVDYLIDEIRAMGDCRLLIIDPLVAFNGANENDNMEMARFMFTLDRIAGATGAAVLVLHHVSKGGQVTSLNEATQAVVRGASALVDNARAAMLLTRMPRQDAPLYGVQPDDAGRFVFVRVVKNNYGPAIPDAVFAIGKGGALRHAPEVQRIYSSPAQASKAVEETETPLRILRTLQEHPEMSQRELAEALNRSQPVINKYMQQLLEDGLLHRIGVGRNTTYEVTKDGDAKLSAAQGGMPPIESRGDDVSELI